MQHEKQPSPEISTRFRWIFIVCESQIVISVLRYSASRMGKYTVSFWINCWMHPSSQSNKVSKLNQKKPTASKISVLITVILRIRWTKHLKLCAIRIIADYSQKKESHTKETHFFFIKNEYEFKIWPHWEYTLYQNAIFKTIRKVHWPKSCNH